MYRFAFIGHPNAGKSTWINYLSNANMKVANYLGVSVEDKCTEICFKDQMLQLIDLPGIYDLDLTNGEESYTRDYLMKEKIDLIVNVIDIRDIKRSLHLTSQLKKLHIPMLVLLNFVDENMNENEVRKLSKLIKTPILFSTLKQKEEILETMIGVQSDYVDCDFDEKALYNVSMNAIKKKYDLDKILLHPYWGIPILIVILCTSIYLIYMISLPFSDLIALIVDGIQVDFIASFHTIPIIDNLIGALWFSISSILSFIPFLCGIFLFLACLEESGYIARIAYLLDTPMHLFHLSGKSVIPMLIGFGCNVPAVLATRTISSRKERVACAIMIPFISCSAKLPVFLLFANVFFKGMQIRVIILLYLLSVLVSLFVASYIASRTKEEEYFLLELPSYAIPEISVVLSKTRKELAHFLRKVGKVMIISMIVLAFVFPLLQSRTYHTLASPLPFATSDIAVESLPFGLISKENLVVYYGQMKQNQSLEAFIGSLWNDPQTKLRAFCYMMYLSMSIPCIMTLAAIRSEFGIKILLVSIVLMLFVPYVLSIAAYHIMILMQVII